MCCDAVGEANRGRYIGVGGGLAKREGTGCAAKEDGGRSEREKPTTCEWKSCPVLPKMESARRNEKYVPNEGVDLGETRLQRTSWRVGVDDGITR